VSIAPGICRRLDGIPLAIELAAGRVDIFGLSKTASLLDDRLNLSWVGRRTALPRHQTLDAALEWSYDLLGEAEKRVLSRLSVFAGGFTLEAAVAVVADETIDEANVSDCVWELRSKSMIAARGQEERLRLPAGTCVYLAACRCIFMALSTQGADVADGKANKPLDLPFLAKGSAFVSGELPESLSAEECFAKAMTQARQESALSFELRAELELARIWIARGEVQRAHDMIGPVYSQLSEGLTTPDLALAKQILEQTSIRARQAGRRVAQSSGRAKA
jgi:predicted ATPase